VLAFNSKDNIEMLNIAEALWDSALEGVIRKEEDLLRTMDSVRLSSSFCFLSCQLTCVALLLYLQALCHNTYNATRQHSYQSCWLPFG
jgi:hypothetical protein